MPERDGVGSRRRQGTHGDGYSEFSMRFKKNFTLFVVAAVTAIVAIPITPAAGSNMINVAAAEICGRSRQRRDTC
ncbi:hypothetical protein E1B28_003009 [Marasmius oreades]|uniref:Uncharacterized protein n=1 Tax=Marasmius oreades TaxID=181124 RepID=A0A9P7RLP2_9AGAR|nr:uncharacterized protein E1B28_003009 [Marasmius oreades]KAG7085448.1 hypothetical protein E1B28_003009 [Marasmius oreades]